MKTTKNYIWKVILLLVAVLSLSIAGKQVQAAPDNSDINSHCSLKQSLVYRAIRERLDFGLSDGKGNGYGLPVAIDEDENKFQAMDPHRMDFGLSDGKGNGYGVPEVSQTIEIGYQAMDPNRLDFGLSDGRGNGSGLPERNVPMFTKVLTLICP